MLPSPSGGGRTSMGRVQMLAQVMSLELWRLMASTRRDMEGFVRISVSCTAVGLFLKSCCQHQRMTSRNKIGLFSS